MTCLKTLLSVVFITTWLTMSCMAAETNARRYQLEPDEVGQVLKTPDGRTVFRYMTQKPAVSKLTANSVCCLYPVNTPKGVPVVEFAAEDHPHHRGIFLAWHGASCGNHRADFWGWGHFAPTEDRVIQNRKAFLGIANDRMAQMSIQNDWMVAEQTVISEALTIDVKETSSVFVIDLNFQFAAKVDVSLDHTAFGGFCVKGRKGNVVYTGPKGKIDLQNPHHLKPETNWPSADWYDYSVELDDSSTVGVAVVDHPSNPATTWHNLEPIHMVNPCIAAPAEVRIKKGNTLGLRYRLVLHDGPSPTDVLKSLAEEFRAE